MLFVFDPITGEIKEVPRKRVEGRRKNEYNQECVFNSKSDINYKIKRRLMANLYIEDEVFRLVPGTEELYISNYGRLKRMKDSQLAYFYTPCYQHGMEAVGVCIIKNGVKKPYKIAKLVAEVFDIRDKYEFYNGRKVIYHIDRNAWNNRVSNLIYLKNSDLAKKMNSLNRKEVAKIDKKNKEVIEYYSSIKEAGKSSFIDRHEVRKYIEKQRQTYDGCFLKFVKEK